MGRGRGVGYMERAEGLQARPGVSAGDRAEERGGAHACGLGQTTAASARARSRCSSRCAVAASRRTASATPPPSPLQPIECNRQIVTEDDVYATDSTVHPNGNEMVNCWWLDRVALEAEGRRCADYLWKEDDAAYYLCQDSPDRDTRCVLDLSVAHPCLYPPSVPPSPPTTSSSTRTSTSSARATTSSSPRSAASAASLWWVSL